MKLLRIVVNGVSRFKEGFDVDLLTNQQIREEDKDSLNLLAKNIYENPVKIFAGINASGKTSTLKLIVFCYYFLCQKVLSLDYFDFFSVEDKPQFELYYLLESKKLIKHIVKFSISDEILNHQIYILDEVIWTKNVPSSMSKNDRYVFDNKMPVLSRKEVPDLPSTVSILFRLDNKKQQRLNCIDLIRVNDNLFPAGLSQLADWSGLLNHIVKFLDPTIKYLKAVTHEDVVTYELQYIHGAKLIYNNEKELFGHMSSGTCKGIWVFIVAHLALCTGDTLVIDEVEGHFNKQVVVSLMKLFNNKTINIHNATLIVSTHYPELMDSLDRNDAIYIMENNGVVDIMNLSSKIQRNDCNRSELFNSNTIFNTAPSYEAYLKLLDAMKKEVNK